MGVLFGGLLARIVEKQLPQGLEAWRAVAVLYQNVSKEENLRRGGDFCICDNRVKKLGEQLKKPKGHPGKQGGSNIRCFENDRPTQQKSNTGIILGTFSAESDHQKKKWAVMTDQMSSNLIITF